jgi:hypothetical protein
MDGVALPAAHGDAAGRLSDDDSDATGTQISCWSSR